MKSIGSLSEGKILVSSLYWWNNLMIDCYQNMSKVIMGQSSHHRRFSLRIIVMIKPDSTIVVTTILKVVKPGVLFGANQFFLGYPASTTKC